jgi:hypothetical protein
MLTSIDQLIFEIQTDRTAKSLADARSRTRWTAHEEKLFEHVPI